MSQRRAGGLPSAGGTRAGVRCGGVRRLGGCRLAAFPRPPHRRSRRGNLAPDDLGKLVSAGTAYRIEGAVCRLGEGQNAEHAAAGHEANCGADVAAAFYRKSALEAAGGFASWADAGHLSADTALRLQQLGFRSLVERRCLAKADPATLGRASAFGLGRESERFFWRWLSAGGRWQSLAGHAALIIGELVIGFWRPSMLLRLAGRACGTIGAVLRKAPTEALEAISAEPAQVLRGADLAPASADHRAKRRKARAA